VVWKTRVTELLGINYPIIQGGLAYLAYLASDDVGTMVPVPQVVDAVSIPVIASGGIGDGWRRMR
jgi:NAD(P)H-dependent flavin oxidoreductase YrpB (nitropropane dioxygenase family)